MTEDVGDVGDVDVLQDDGQVDQRSEIKRRDAERSDATQCTLFPLPFPGASSFHLQSLSQDADGHPDVEVCRGSSHEDG